MFKLLPNPRPFSCEHFNPELVAGWLDGSAIICMQAGTKPTPIKYPDYPPFPYHMSRTSEKNTSDEGLHKPWFRGEHIYCFGLVTAVDTPVCACGVCVCVCVGVGV